MDLPPRCEPVRPDVLIETTLAEAFAGIPPTNVVIRRPDDESLLLSIELRKILRATVNIVQNARDAIGTKGGSITFAISPVNSQMVRLTISNTNSFIKPEDLPRVLKSFFTAKKNGTGLGLAIAQKVVDAHGGVLSVESTEATGVSFYLTLPLHNAAISSRDS